MLEFVQLRKQLTIGGSMGLTTPSISVSVRVYLQLYWPTLIYTWTTHTKHQCHTHYKALMLVSTLTLTKVLGVARA